MRVADDDNFVVTVPPHPEDDLGVEGGGPPDDEVNQFLPGDEVGVELDGDGRHGLVQRSPGTLN